MATRKHVVSGDQYYGITGQLLEILRQLRMRGGSPLDPEKVRIALQRIIEPGYKEGIGLHEFPLGGHALDSVLARLRASGYLDTSFDGREVHPLIIRPLTKKQALTEYRNSGGKTWVLDELEKNMPYTVPNAEALDVMIMNFGETIKSYDAIDKMDKLGVRSPTGEEFIQYCIKHPKQKALVALGTKDILCGNLRVLFQTFDAGVRRMKICGCDAILSAKFRFPVVPK